MKCNFNTTPAMMVTAYVLLLASVLGTGILIISLCFFESVFLIVSCVLVIFSLIFVLNIKRGMIQADEKGICISRYFFGRYILKKSIDYCDIDSYKCQVEVVQGKYRIKYKLVTIIKVSNGDELVYFTDLNIPPDLPANNHDKYKKIVETHPVMELREYVSKNIRAYLSDNMK